METRRYFIDVGERQALIRTCGSRDFPPLLMLHGSPGSSYSVMPLGRHLASGRRVICLDTPGNGDSAPLPVERPEIGDYADALVELLDALSIDRTDLYGYHTGASIVVEFSIRYPDRARRLLLDGVSLFDPKYAETLIDAGHAPHIAPDHEGTQYNRAAMMVRDAHLFWPWWAREADRLRGLGLPDPRDLHFETLEVLKAPETYYLSYHAALRYPKDQRLPLVPVPALVAANPKDQLYGYLEPVCSLIPDATRLETEPPCDPERNAKTARAFLDFLD